MLCDNLKEWDGVGGVCGCVYVVCVCVLCVGVCMCVCVSCSVVSNSLLPHGIKPQREV